MPDLQHDTCDNSNKIVTNNDTNKTNNLEQELTHVISSSYEQIPEVSDTSEWWPTTSNLRNR